MNQENTEIKYHFENAKFAKHHSEILNNLSELVLGDWLKTERFDKPNEDVRAFQEEANELKYRDPDKAKYENDTELEESSYYNWLTRFLNERALECFKNKIINKNLLFVPPEKAGTVKEGDFWNCPNPTSTFRSDQNPKDFENLRRDPSKILVYELNEDGKVKNPNEPYLRLTSDQLGFSAISNDLYDDPELLFYKKYPLYRLFYLGIKEGISDIDGENINEFISNFIYDTRTLGGAFVWPTNDTEVDGDINCNYNRERGVRWYIEDRADLTLLEVKCYYEDKEKNQLVLKANKGSEMYKFLELFRCRDDEDPSKSFRNFVKFFMFDSFVVNKKGDLTPKNIRDKNLNPFKFDDEKYNIGTPLRLSKDDLDAKELKTILERVQDMVFNRTRAMEAILPQV